MKKLFLAVVLATTLLTTSCKREFKVEYASGKVDTFKTQGNIIINNGVVYEVYKEDTIKRTVRGLKPRTVVPQQSPADLSSFYTFLYVIGLLGIVLFLLRQIRKKK